MKHLESAIQKACVRYFRYQYPQYLIYANANGGARSSVEAGIMKGEGVLAGIPDLTIITDDRVIWVEMKSSSGAVSQLQDAMMKKIQNLGHIAIVVRSLDEFITNLNKYIHG
jgi:hypothetical protein